MIPSFERRHSAGFHLKAEGQLVAGAVGAVVGFYVGGPTGAQWGYAIGAGLYAVSQPGPHSEGPKLTDLKLTGTDYGRPIPYVRGHPRIPGDVIYASEKRPIANTTEQGKGGGASYTSYTYEIDVFFLLSDNEIAGVSRIWDNGKLIWTCLEGSSLESLEASATTDKWDRMTVYTGAADQLPDPTYEAAVGIGRAPAVRGRGSVFIQGLKLGTSGQMSILTFEIARTAQAAGGLFFEVEMADDATDSTLDPVAPTFTNPGQISFLGPGDTALFTNDFVNDRGGQIAWTHGKLDTLGDQGKMNIEAVVAPGPIYGSGTSNVQRFFSVEGSGIGASFGFRIVSGVLHLYSTHTNVGTTAVDHGPPVSDTFRIVINDPAPECGFH